jgi:hypothetical protein
MRKNLPFEAYCVAANITTKRMLEVVTGACFEQSDAVASLVSKAAKPVLLQKSVKMAQKTANWEDRKMIMQHEGYAPVPKTQVINVGGDVNTDNRVQSVSIAEITGIESKMARITDRFNERLGIGDGKIKQIDKEIDAAGVDEDTFMGDGVIEHPDSDPAGIMAGEVSTEPDPDDAWEIEI